MDLSTLQAVTSELQGALIGRRLGSLFQLSRFEFLADFRTDDGRWLLVSIEPSFPRTHLVRRRLRDVEKNSINPSSFLVTLRKRFANAVLKDVRQLDGERVLFLDFTTIDHLDERDEVTLVLQLTGRSANVFLTDEDHRVIASFRDAKGNGQTIGETYSPPERPTTDTDSRNADAIANIGNVSISEQIDQLYLEQQTERTFQKLAQNARSRITGEIKRKEKLLKNLRQDLVNHGEAVKWKRFGDILLANIATAKKDNDAFLVTDYFDEEQKQILIPFENNDTPSETAEKYFRRYTKARNAADEIAKRLLETESELKILGERLLETEEHIADRNIDALEGVGSLQGRVSSPHVSKGSRSKPQKHKPDERSGYRTFISSDGFEILVGKKAKDNDQLTLRVAKSLDTWMHAADYPGSHVVIRDSGKREVPNQTLLEAAQLAAFYSQGRKQVKAAVHYTQKKFVNKPKGSAPGLVSLASFKTLLVEPKIPDGIKNS